MVQNSGTYLDPIQNKYFTIGIDSFDLIKILANRVFQQRVCRKIKRYDYEIDEESLIVL